MKGTKQTHRKLLINHAVLRREMQNASDVAWKVGKGPLLRKCHLRKPQRMSSQPGREWVRDR